MITLRLWLLLILGFSVINASVVAQGGTISNTQPEQAKLRLSTTIVTQRISLQRDLRTLHLTLKLTYTNDGTLPILLDRKSVLIYRTMVSKSLKAAASRRYIVDRLYYFTNMTKAGLSGSDPEEGAFVTLRAGESFTVPENVEVVIGSAPKEKNFLSDGDYFLQVRVTTWYYFVEPGEYRERWIAKGYLWANNMTSQPMRFSTKSDEASNNKF
jgi:hypothetical protein